MAGYEPLVGPAAAVQAKPQAGAPAPSASPASVKQGLGKGEAMAPDVTARFSQAYGHDLSDVRLHRDSPSASALGARAVTVGRDVAFAPGEYKPGTPAGDRLIGHELAHVVQQSGGAGVVQGAGLGSDGFEREADRAADAALSGGRVTGLSVVAASGSRPQVIQRAPLDPSNPKAWSELGDVRAKFPEVFAETLSGAEGARAKLAGELRDSRPPETEQERAAFAQRLETLVRLQALALMNGHRGSIVARRAETLAHLRASGPAGAGARTQELDEVRALASFATELGSLKKELEGFRAGLRDVEVEADKPSADPPLVAWFKALADNARTHQGPQARLVLASAREAVGSRRSKRELALVAWGNAGELRKWREQQIAATDIALAQVYAAAPFLAKVDPHDISGAANEGALVKRISDGYDDLLTKVDDAIASIGAGQIHPFELPQAVETTKASLPVPLRPEVDRAVEGHQEHEFWVSLGLTAAQALLVLVPVIGQVAALGRGAAMAARIGVYVESALSAAPWTASAMGVAATGAAVGDMRNRDTVAAASTSPDQTMLGVGKASKLEWAMRAVEAVLAAASIRTNIKASLDARTLRGLRLDLARLEGAEPILPGAPETASQPRRFVADGFDVEVHPDGLAFGEHPDGRLLFVRPGGAGIYRAAPGRLGMYEEIKVYGRGGLPSKMVVNASGEGAMVVAGPTGEMIPHGAATPTPGQPLALPAATRLEVGGINTQPGPLEPTIYNPCGLTTNCGFVAISRALHLQTGVLTDADQLYIATLKDLGLPTDTPGDPLSRMLIFPEQRVFEDVSAKRGYEPLFGGTKGPEDYTVLAVARARGLAVQSLTPAELLKNRTVLFPPGGFEQALEARLQRLGMSADDPRVQKVEAYIHGERRKLTGEYIVGSKTSKHFMNVRIQEDGSMIGIDEQDGKMYHGNAAVMKKLGGSIDVMLKVAGTDGSTPLRPEVKVP